MRPLPGFVALLSLSLAALPAAAVKRRAFVTSSVGNGNLASWSEAGGEGALDAADNVCRARAAAASLPNSQSYRAWLSTAATDAYCHVRGQTGKKANGCVGTAQAAGPWYRSNGSTPWSGTLDELVEENVLYRAILTNEFGTAITGAGHIWTGTRSTGDLLPNQNCTSWVVGTDGADGRVGVADRTADAWSSNFFWPCNNLNHLLCLEPGTSEAPVPTWGRSAIAFATSEWGTGDLSSWPSSGGEDGLDGADNVCRSLAAAAHLPEPDSFVAWLSDATTNARDRLLLTATPFRRVDGVVVASSKSDLLDGELINSIHVDEKGGYPRDHTLTWSGTSSAGGKLPDRCAEWTVGDSGDEGSNGALSFAYSESWTDIGPNECHQTLRLYCFSNAETLFWDGFELTGDTERWSEAAP